MSRIKVFTAHLGFYETAVAARSQKLALAHWGVARDLFRDGSARETNDPKAVQAAMRKVGMVVRRPIGSHGPFEERAEAERSLLQRFGSRRKNTGSKQGNTGPTRKRSAASKRHPVEKAKKRR